MKSEMRGQSEGPEMRARNEGSEKGLISGPSLLVVHYGSSLLVLPHWLLLLVPHLDQSLTSGPTFGSSSSDRNVHVGVQLLV